MNHILIESEGERDLVILCNRSETGRVIREILLVTSHKSVEEEEEGGRGVGGVQGRAVGVRVGGAAGRRETALGARMGTHVER